MIDYAAVYSALYSRAATDSAGAALRGLLGVFPSPFPPDTAFAGQRAVFPADRLGLFAAAGVTLPWAVWRAGTTSGASGDMRDVGGAWWVYAAPAAGDRALHTVAAAVDALYGYDQAYAITGGHIQVTHAGQPIHDSALGLRGMEVRIGFRQLG